MHIRIYNIIIEIQKLSSMLKVVKDPKYHYDNMEMESHSLPKSHSKSTTEPQYEDCGGGVISSNVAMEDNPAYQSVDIAAAKPWTVELKLYRNSTCMTTQMQLMWTSVFCTILVCSHIGDCVYVCHYSVHECVYFK